MLNAHHVFAEENSVPSTKEWSHGGDRPIDLVHLCHHTLGNRELEREILRLFAKQTGIYFMRVSTASSMSEWQDAIHTIKGSARGVGAWSVVKCAERAEKLKALKPAKQRTKLVAALEVAIDEANEFIVTVLSDYDD